MSIPLRIMSSIDSGSFLFDGNRIPYLTGCDFLLKSVSSFTFGIQLTSEIATIDGQLGLVLEIRDESTLMFRPIQIFLSYTQHSDFLNDVLEAPAIYLLAGESIVVTYHNRAVFMNRLANHGQGIAISQQVREVISDLKQTAESRQDICGTKVRLMPRAV